MLLQQIDQEVPDREIQVAGSDCGEDRPGKLGGSVLIQEDTDLSAGHSGEDDDPWELVR